MGQVTTSANEMLSSIPTLLPLAKQWELYYVLVVMCLSSKLELFKPNIKLEKNDHYNISARLMYIVMYIYLFHLTCTYLVV